MKNISIVFFIFGVLIANHSNADHVLYCQEKLNTGFKNEEGLWRSANFKTKRYTIKFKNDYSTLEGLQKGNTFSCFPTWAHLSLDSLACISEVGGQTFTFNKKTNKFQYSSPKPEYGYDVNGTDTENFSVGTCEKF
jgi:hypothetical protein